MAERFNQRAEASGRTAPVSASTMTKPPSAELAPDQTDQDSLPPYDELDAILRSHIEGGSNTDDLMRGFAAATVMDVLQRLERNEHKRWQMPPAPRCRPGVRPGLAPSLASNHDWRR